MPSTKKLGSAEKSCIQNKSQATGLAAPMSWNITVYIIPFIRRLCAK